MNDGKSGRTFRGPPSLQRSSLFNLNALASDAMTQIAGGIVTATMLSFRLERHGNDFLGNLPAHHIGDDGGAEKAVGKTAD